MDNIWCNPDLSFETYDQLITIIDEHQTVRESLLDSLMSIDPNHIRDLEFCRDFYTLLAVNDKCFCRGIVEGRSPDTLFTVLTTEGKSGKVGTAYQIEIRGHPNMKLIIKSIKNIEYGKYLFILIEPLSPDNLRNNILTNEYFHQHPFYSVDGKPIVIAIRSDDFANQTILHMLIDQVLRAYTNVNYVYQYDAFICGNQGRLRYQKDNIGYIGYNIMEIANRYDLSTYLESFRTPLTLTIVDDILIQVLSPLQILQQPEYAFIHGDLKAKNVFVHENPDHSIIYKIADYDKSSITWRGIRIYNRGGKYTAEAGKTASEAVGSFVNYASYIVNPISINGVDYYQIPSSSTAQIAIRHNPIPFYSSYDIYTFLFSLMMEPVFYDWYMKTRDSNFHHIWALLWERSQFGRINNIIANKHINYQRLTGDAKRLELVDMRSISAMNALFYKEGIYLRRDVQFIYEMLDFSELQIIDVQGLPPDFFTTPIMISSTEYKPCSSPCQIYKYVQTPEAYGYKAPDDFIDFGETSYPSTYVAPSEIMACRTYPYSKLRGGEFTWDHCQQR